MSGRGNGQGENDGQAGRDGRGENDQPQPVDQPVQHDEPAQPDLQEIEEIDGLVDRVLAGSASATPDEDGDLVSSMQRVRGLADEPLPAETRTRHLRRLRTHDAAGTPAAHRTSPPSRGSRRRGVGAFRRRSSVVAAASLAVLMLTAGSAVGLAQGADPDDLLYGVKRASEQAWLAVPRGSERAAEVHLAMADRRLNEARRAPAHAERLVAEGIENAEVAAEELPGEAVENLLRRLGDGPDRLPDNASPAARAALHRNCVRISERHDLGPERCGPAPEGGHPGRGRGLGDGEHPGRGLGPDGEGHPGKGRALQDGDGVPRRGPKGDEEGSRGWGPGGRPDGAVGPPPGTPREGQGSRGWGPGGRPDGAVGPPPGTPGHERWEAETDEDPAEE